MTTISKAHQRLSERLQDPRILTNPEEFLGPNYKAVLDFWRVLDELSKDQWRTISRRNGVLYFNQHPEWNRAAIEAHDASDETIGREFTDNASYAAHDVYGNAAYYATRELIGMHLILEQNKPLIFLQMFLEVL